MYMYITFVEACIYFYTKEEDKLSRRTELTKEYEKKVAEKKSAQKEEDEEGGDDEDGEHRCI